MINKNTMHDYTGASKEAKFIRLNSPLSTADELIRNVETKPPRCQSKLKLLATREQPGCLHILCGHFVRPT